MLPESALKQYGFSLPCYSELCSSSSGFQYKAVIADPLPTLLSSLANTSPADNNRSRVPVSDLAAFTPWSSLSTQQKGRWALQHDVSVLWWLKGKGRDECSPRMRGLHAHPGLQLCYSRECSCARKRLPWLMIFLHDVYFLFCYATFHWQMCSQCLGSPR